MDMYGNIKAMGRSKCAPNLCGYIKRFGEVKDLRLEDGGNGKWAVYSKDRQFSFICLQFRRIK